MAAVGCCSSEKVVSGACGVCGMESQKRAKQRMIDVNSSTGSGGVIIVDINEP